MKAGTPNEGRTQLTSSCVPPSRCCGRNLQTLLSCRRCCEMRIAKCRMRIADCEMRNVKCRMRNAEMRNVECGLRNVDCGLQNCGMQNCVHGHDEMTGRSVYTTKSAPKGYCLQWQFDSGQLIKTKKPNHAYNRWRYDICGVAPSFVVCKAGVAARAKILVARATCHRSVEPVKNLGVTTQPN